ncbi:site-specific integrase [Atlantibacter subterranea]|uniref:Site-specific integrase n=1 Tax=Atlantibacter subterraneus TaxID=255519 RepID=A0ABU4E996_9ENTR|nr:site-specific integrase [Atlantibacter subterranea]MDV7025159.1 site-specific integrase [Atlantibacter subterranea]
MPLNDTKLRRIDGKPYDGPDELPDGGGLSARISPKGLITFQYRYRFNGKPVRLKLGTYGKLSIKEAREAMEQCKKWLEEGKDPAVQRKLVKEQAASSPSISVLVDEWLESPSVKELVKYEYWTRMLKLHVTDKYGRMIVDDMDPTHWEKIFLSISKAGSPVQAGNVLVKMKQVVRYALRRKRITSNALMLLELNDVGKRPEDGERYLNDEEIGLFWNSVSKTKMAWQNQLMIKLIFLTGCRGVELRLARKVDFNLKERYWVIPKENSKTRKRFVRGISRLAAEYLEQIFNLYPNLQIVFPPAKIQEDRPMAASTLISFAEQVEQIMGCPHWSNHDFRRTCKTKMAEMGVAPHVSEKILGHKLTGMLAIYDQYDYIPEQQEAADKWAEKIQLCASGSSPLSLQN